MAMAADDDADVFEITDFTTASDWERFIARLEEILHEWRLVNFPALPPVAKDEFTIGNWEERSDDLQFADVKFVITYHYLTSVETAVEETTHKQDDTDDGETDVTPTVFQDMMSMENDFPSRAHCLCRWYGLRNFLVIAPASNTEQIDIESRAKLLLSSVFIALGNTGCPIPTFVQVQQKWRRLYSGACVLPGSSVHFEMAHLKKLPQQYSHLAGLLDVFKSELGCAITPLPPVSVSVRFTYMLQDWVNSSWPQIPPDFSAAGEDEVGCTGFGNLPFGACEDPVSELHLSCTWPCLSEDIIVENQVYSDLDPLQAPQWSVRIQMKEDPQCLLGDYLVEFLEVCHSKESTNELLGGIIKEESEKDLSSDISYAFQRLTDPVVPSLSSVISQTSTRLKIKPGEAPIHEPLLNEMLVFLFPDALASNNAAATEECFTVNASRKDMLQDLAKQLKSAPLDSLTSRLAICFCIVNNNHGRLKAVAQLWQEFVLEMRYRLENSFLITGIETGPPNMGSCLLHQKLQMLNCCIERKRKRDALSSGSASGTTSPWDSPQHNPYSDRQFCASPVMQTNICKHPGIDSVSSSDDEFFECSDTNNDSTLKDCTEEDMKNSTESLKNVETNSATSDTSFKDSYSYTAEGRLRQCGKLKLLNSQEPLYIPVTQEPTPMTEDMLEEHAEVLAKLGTSAEGSLLRAQMQSACLLSDMEAFKAANPNCNLEDFVRWYSPRDWIEDEDANKVVKGNMSQRMQIEGNVWVQVWQSSRAVPVSRQKRLFDDTKEAEKVLHFLSSLKPAQVTLYLFPVLIHAAIVKIIQNEDQDIPKLKQLVEQISAKAAKVTRSANQDLRKYEDLIQMIILAETVIARAKSLKSKFTEDLLDQKGAEEELHHFVSSLLQQPEVPVRGGPCGPAGSIIHKLFVAEQKNSYLLLEDLEDPDDSKPASTVPDFPNPSAREYILRTVIPRPAPYSRPLPQRLYCVLLDNDYRLAGAYTSDTVFE